MSPDQTFAPPGLRAENLTLRRGDRVLFSALNFTLGAGEALLLRGPNGAGKSSLILSICGALRPDVGRIIVTGHPADAPPETALHLIGHAPGIKDQLGVAENLRFWATLHSGDSEAVAPALRTVGLDGLEQLPAAYLSAGQTRRLALARLLVAHRPIWLLDEPTAALDQDGESLLIRLIDEHLESGGLVLAATHHDLPLRHAARTLHLGGAT